MSETIIQGLQAFAFIIIWIGSILTYRKQDTGFLRKLLATGGAFFIVYLVMLFKKVDLVYVLSFNAVYLLINLQFGEILLILQSLYDFIKQKNTKKPAYTVDDSCLSEDIQKTTFIARKKREIKELFLKRIKEQKVYFFLGGLIIMTTIANLFLFFKYVM